MRSAFSLSIFGVFLALVPCLAEMNTPNSDVQANMSDIKDIYGPIVLPDTSIWLYLLIGAVILLITALLLFFFYKRRNSEPVVEIPPHEQALTELEQAEHHIEKNQSLLYAEKVSEILRTYLERRFEMHSTRQTTREFLDSLVTLPKEKQNVLLSHRQSLQSCLEQCDMAKYAHKTTGQENMQQLKTRIVSFIKETVAEDNE